MTFDLGPEKKKLVLQSAGAKWREFKSRLTTHYVLPYKDDPESTQFPPDDYRFINVDDWKLFVSQRTTDDFMVSYLSLIVKAFASCIMDSYLFIYILYAAIARGSKGKASKKCV